MQQAWWQADHIGKTGGKRADTAVADLKTDLGHAQRGGQQELARSLQPESRKKLARWNPNQTPKHTIEVKWPEAGSRGKVVEAKRLMQVSMHDLDNLLDGRSVRREGAGRNGCG